MRILTSLLTKQLAILTILLLLSIPAADAQNTTVWKRHAIDNSLKGADGVRFGDVNRDGLADIVTGWEQSGLVRIYINPGKAKSKEKWPYVTVGVAPDVEDAVLVDLDADGSLDLVSSSEGKTRRVQVHWAPAPGRSYTDSTLWKTEIIPATDGVFQWMFATPLQIDGQHGVDLIVAGKRDNAKLPQPYIGWLKAPANPRDLAAWQWFPLAKVSWVMSVIVSDINGDRLPDIVYSDRKEAPTGIKWLQNPGPTHAEGPWQNRIISDSTQQFLFMDLNDLDGDGRQDAIVVTKEDQIHFYRKLTDDGLRWQKHLIHYPANVGGGKAVTIADVDLDGRKDLVLSSEGAKDGKSGVYYLRYRTSPFETDWLRNEISGPQGMKYDLVPGYDFDGDGDPDFVTTEENDNSSGGFGGLGVVWFENPATKPTLQHNPHQRRDGNYVRLLQLLYAHESQHRNRGD